MKSKLFKTSYQNGYKYIYHYVYDKLVDVYDDVPNGYTYILVCSNGKPIKKALYKKEYTEKIIVNADLLPTRPQGRPLGSKDREGVVRKAKPGKKLGRPFKNN